MPDNRRLRPRSVLINPLIDSLLRGDITREGFLDPVQRLALEDEYEDYIRPRQVENTIENADALEYDMTPGEREAFIGRRPGLVGRVPDNIIQRPRRPVEGNSPGLSNFITMILGGGR